MKTQIKELNKKILDLKEARKTVLRSVDILPSRSEERKGYEAAQAINELINYYIHELEYLEKLPPEYQFYFEYKKGGRRHNVESVRCKRPKQLKIYKGLAQNFNEGFIEVYGYEVVESN